jgi:hypothetical protein
MSDVFAFQEVDGFRLNMETHLDQIEVVSILELPYAGEPFPGHDRLIHTLGLLEVAVSLGR